MHPMIKGTPEAVYLICPVNSGRHKYGYTAINTSVRLTMQRLM